MKKVLIYCLLIAGVSLLGSCSKWLEVNPKAKVAEKVLFESEDGFKDALTSCYIKMNHIDLYGRTLTFKEIEWMAQHWTTTSFNNNPETLLKNFDYNATVNQNLFNNIYLLMYNTITQANIVLANIEEKGDVVIKETRLRNVIEGEALSIRAFCHFDILRMFGQVPQNPTKLVSLPYAEKVSLNSIPYYNYNKFVEKILEDLNKAEKLLEKHDPVLDPAEDGESPFLIVSKDNDYLSYRRFRFNYFSTLALKARIYLYIGDNTNANKYANEVINKSGLQLAGLNDYGANNFALPSECILALSNFEMSKNIENVFGGKGLFLDDGALTPDLFPPAIISSSNRALFVWDRANSDSQGNIKPIVRKFNQPKADEYVTTIQLVTLKQVMPLIRLSEMYLIAIETTTNEVEAKQQYKTLMTARGINLESKPPTWDEIQADIVPEYRREFFAEGQMFYVYKRNGAKNMLWKNDRPINELDYVVPSPSAKIN